ncbi:MAG: dienelactone hydrolase family protein [Acidimicrobiales bacterium]
MRIELPSGTSAETVRPPETPSRGVVLLPDIMGLRPLFDELVAGLASDHGWAVIAPEPFPERESVPVPERLATMAAYDHHRQVADALAAANVLGVEPVAVAGFCMGGMGALRAMGTGRFDKAVSFYGMIRLPEAWSGGTDAIDDLLAEPGAAANVLAIIGGADSFTPVAHVGELEAAGATVVVYEGAEHGFVHDPNRPTHRADDAADAWRRLAEWLDVPDF